MNFFVLNSIFPSGTERKQSLSRSLKKERLRFSGNIPLSSGVYTA